jgi:hypothetical protein
VSLTAFLAACAAFVTTIEGVRRGSLPLMWLGRVLGVFAVVAGLAGIAR